MIESFAKLFDTAHGQLLVTRDYDPNEDSYSVVVRNGEGIEFRMSGWEDDEDASRKALEATDQARAEKHSLALYLARKGLA